MFNIMLVTFQLPHYKERIKEARSIEERIHCKVEYNRIKQSFITFYN